MNTEPHPTADVVAHLTCIEHAPFYPVGWLYTHVYEDLRLRGLAVLTIRGYEITQAGRALLDAHRSAR